MNDDWYHDYKSQLMKDILTNTEIVSLVSGSDDPNFDAASLKYTQVFPYEFVPETSQEGLTYVCFDVDVDRVYNKNYLEPVVYIWVFSHKSALRTADGRILPDDIAVKIINMINGSRYYGLGQLEFASMKRFAPMSDYLGKRIVFESSEFNRQYDGNLPVPSNRRLG